MKNTVKLIALCLGLVVIQTIQTVSLSDTWNKAKNKAYSTKESISNKWENLDESTKNAIIGTGVAAAGTAAVAGAAYGGYKAYENNSSVYGPGPSLEEIQNKQSFSGSGKTVEQEVSDLDRERNRLPIYNRPAFQDIITDED